MDGENLVVRGTESALRVFQDDLRAFVAREGGGRGAPATAPLQPARRRLTDPAPLGHEPWVELVLEIGKWAAIGIVAPVAKDLLVAWIKEQAKKRGLLAESKPG